MGDKTDAILRQGGTMGPPMSRDDVARELAMRVLGLELEEARPFKVLRYVQPRYLPEENWDRMRELAEQLLRTEGGDDG